MSKRDEFLKLNKQKSMQAQKEAKGFTMDDKELIEEKPKEEEKTAVKEAEKKAVQPKPEPPIDEKSPKSKKTAEPDGPELTTIQKVEIPKEKRNNTVTKTISIDKDTLATLGAYVNILKASGAKIDKRPITDSAFVRLALIHEFERISELNGEGFKDAVEEEIHKVPEKKASFKC